LEPINYLGALRRSWRLLVTLGLVGLVIAVLIPVSGHKGRVRQIPIPWSAVALVGSPPVIQGTTVGGGANAAQIAFYASNSKVMRETVNSVGLGHIRTQSLTTYLKATVVVPPDSGKRQAANADTVRVIGHGTSSKEALRLTNAYAKEIGITLSKAAAGHVTARGVRSSGYQILTRALTATKARPKRPSAGPVKSRKIRALIGLGLGVLLAAIIVLAREVMSRRLRTAGRAEGTFGYPVVVEIPVPLRSIGRRSLSVDVVSDPMSPAAEAYRMLRMSVLFEALASKVAPQTDYSMLLTDTGTLGGGPAGGSGDPNARSGAGPTDTGRVEERSLLPEDARKVVLVVSASREPTRPQVAANLAAAYAEAGERVIVIGTGDLGAGQIEGGGTNVTGEITPEDIERQLESSWVDRVFRLDLRNFLSSSGQLVNRMPSVLHAARAVSDVIVVEAPPMLAVHHVEALAHLVDVVLVVGEAGTTTFDEARRSGDFLRRMAAPVLGVVLTNVRLPYGDPRQELGRIQHELANSSGGATLPQDSLDSDLEPSGSSAHSPA
jgi:Mrp family chromosome partitioning ATPase